MKMSFELGQATMCLQMSVFLKILVFLLTWYSHKTTFIIGLPHNHPTETTRGKAKHFIASISQRYTSNWSKATLKGQQPISESYKRKRHLKTERNRAVGTTEPLQHTQRRRHGSSGGEGSQFNAYIRLLVPPSEVSEPKVFRLKQNWHWSEMLHCKKWQSAHTEKRLKSLATVGYLSSKPLCVCVHVCLCVRARVCVCVQHQEPNLLRNIWFKVFTGMQMGWKHLDRHVS